MNLINRMLRRTGWMVVRRPSSAQMLHEEANVVEAHHPARGSASWLRKLAHAVHDSDRGDCQRRFCETCLVRREPV